MSTTRELTERVAQTISGHSFTVEVEVKPTRDYASGRDLAEIGNGLYCYVVPMGRSDPQTTGSTSTAPAP